MGYHGLAGLGYAHQRRSQRVARARGDDPAELLPAGNRTAALAKRWLPGTHQGSVDEAHLPGSGEPASRNPSQNVASCQSGSSTNLVTPPTIRGSRSAGC
jgi:hypothetical protein